MKKIITFIIFCQLSYAQTNDRIFERLRVLENKEIFYYNIDGFVITNQKLNYEFNDKGLKKAFKKYKIKDSDAKIYEDKLAFNNLHVVKKDTIAKNLVQHNSFYFIENSDKTINIIAFAKINVENYSFERDLIEIIMKNKIPFSCFDTLNVDKINFAGRTIQLSNSCYWTNINTVQCPYYGEMNWSVHSNYEDAQQSVDNQFQFTKSKKIGKVISEETVDIIFEGNETKAKKVVFEFKGINSILLGMNGDKQLNVYYVATLVRNNYVSCVLSFWNSDNIKSSGLPPFLEEVMKIRN